MNVVHHRRERGEIERHVVAQCPARIKWYDPMTPFINQFLVTYIYPRGRLARTVTAMQSIVQNPWQIITVYDAPDEGVFSV